jgi:Reverse transcriptase (RNA-dependent DNA polymerase)
VNHEDESIGAPEGAVDGIDENPVSLSNDDDSDVERIGAREQSRPYLMPPEPTQFGRGFAQPGKVLKLKRSLYGLKQSPRNFFLHLKSKLESVGLKSQEEVDPCLFVSEKVICIVYVDDCLWFSPRKEWIDEVLETLKNRENVELEVESSVAGFLGVHMERNEKEGTVTLTQSGLIKRVITALGVGDLPRKFTPASRVPLSADKEGDPPQGTYSYASVIGMLQYLQAHSRPDITYAVSQCARFIHNTKRSHEEALERIGQYLKSTQDKGLVLRPSHDSLNVDCYVDADFAGLWPYEDKQDPSCVKSRTGFSICVANCPVIWSSKIQVDIATSTMEAEYNALSAAMKSVLPLLELLKTVAKGSGVSDEHVTKFKTTVWEDNVGALTLANMEPGRMTPRSKFYAVKYHWFRSHLKPNRVEVVKIDTKEQRADILTKGLVKATFEHVRRLLCGW